MRIAYIINSVEGGGAAFPVPSILSLMRDLGAEVKLFALTKKDGRAIDPLEKASIPIIVRESGVKDHYQTLLWLQREVKTYQPTHLWTSLTRATLLGQLVGLHQKIPVISWQHAAYLKPWNLRLLKVTRNLSQLWVADSDKISILTQQRLKIPSERIITWPIFKATPNAPQAQPWKTGTKIQITTMGRLHPVKGFDVLIEACHLLEKQCSLPPYEINIYGEGQEYAYLKSLIHQYHLENTIQLSGFTANVEETLAKNNLYIQPSRSEGFCVAAHEAMQAGLPIIASAVGELPYSIQNNKTGLIVPPENPKALAKALHQFLQNPSELYSMGQQARQRVLHKFSAEHFNQVGKQIFDHMNNLNS